MRLSRNVIPRNTGFMNTAPRSIITVDLTIASRNSSLSEKTKETTITTAKNNIGIRQGTSSAIVTSLFERAVRGEYLLRNEGYSTALMTPQSPTLSRCSFKAERIRSERMSNQTIAVRYPPPSRRIRSPKKLHHLLFVFPPVLTRVENEQRSVHPFGDQFNFPPIRRSVA